LSFKNRNINHSNNSTITRRAFLGGAAALAAGLAVPPAMALPPEDIMQIMRDVRPRVIPSSGEKIPAIGMGTWITFNTGRSPELLERRMMVLRGFLAMGGGMIDSSPMYGSSEAVLGRAIDILHGIDGPDTSRIFAAGKIWTQVPDLRVWQSTAARGRAQIEESQTLWGIEKFDLMQVHNLVDWQTHLKTLYDLREKGRIRYIGMTTSHGLRHAELEKIMKDENIDFVQLTYNILDRAAENRLLPLAEERGIAVIANRPFRQGRLFDFVAGRPLPAWAREETGSRNWAQFFLKYIITRPEITCAIPATTRIEHMLENMEAMGGMLPDAQTRRKMADYVTGF